MGQTKRKAERRSRIPALLPPGLSEARMDEVPALGEHTRAILTELGYDSETIDLLVTENAI
jgi:crotonobetainyl-CoA:carnitine CoA-transferase CaiB-like acyl-CoA transferase